MRILFVAMPFAPVGHPCLGISQLKAEVEAAGHEASIRYFNLEFLAAFEGDPKGKLDHYGAISSGGPLITGEWIFAESMFGEPIVRRDPAQIEGMRKRYVEGMGEVALFDQILHLRRQAGPFVERCLEAVDWAAWDVVGFTSTFFQNLASFALARRIKERHPDVRIAFGGANADGPMGIQAARSFPFLDLVARGEADHSLPLLLDRLESGAPLGDVPGLVWRDEGGRIVVNPDARPIDDLESLPYPDFDDYFEQLAAEPAAAAILPTLPFESSRGCWWGEKHHCTFCGLNANGMGFRRKSEERVLAEIVHLVERHGVKDLAAVDNIIEVTYLKTLLPEIERRRMGLNLFYETKANLKKEQVRSLAAAGVRWIQPGIESLSTDVLKIMRKGVTGLQNVQLLKWAQEHDMILSWNLLYGFPHEPPEAYEAIRRWVPSLVHLQPPGSSAPIQLDRFSPYFEFPDEFGIRNIRPKQAYRNVYDLPEEEIHGLAYRFDFDFPDGRNPATYYAPVEEALEDWRRHHRLGDRPLSHLAGESVLYIRDRRHDREAVDYLMTGLQAVAFDYCDSIRSRKAILAHLSDPAVVAASQSRFLQSLLFSGAGEVSDLALRGLAEREGATTPEPLAGYSIDEGDLDAFLDLVVEGGLFLAEGDRYLALTVPASSKEPTELPAMVTRYGT